ncbi:hypothetical protein ASZ90_014174 [hydrocarbon metagenome]|uniref:Uncharacterized protein n=1 Tax=hydrocarbon metagenome TaxID=938273 RepID=A0A0W8F5T7_9ZZZZ
MELALDGLARVERDFHRRVSILVFVELALDDCDSRAMADNI